MKRLLSALLMTAFLVTLCVTASAEGSELSMKYIPRTERGTLFYLDIYSDPAVSAAVFELRFDPSAVEYRDTDCDDESGRAMGNSDGDVVKIAYSHHSSKSGKLCRLSFKALKIGTVRFTLHMTQAVDADLAYLTNLSDFSLEVKLGKDDVVLSDSSAQNDSSDKASAQSKKSSEKSQKKSYGGEKSEIAEVSADDAGSTEATEGAPLDFTGGNNKLWFLLGGAVALSAVLLVGAGYFIGKKRMGRPAKKDAQDGEKNADDPMDEIDKIIDKESK